MSLLNIVLVYKHRSVIITDYILCLYFVQDWLNYDYITLSPSPLSVNNP